MAKREHQKLKLLYLIKILSEETDDRHALTVQELIDRLKDYEISAERKAIYRDLEELKIFGYDIISEQISRNVYYHLGCRSFELPELKLLVDSVQSAKFITEKKSSVLIRKLESFVSKYDAKYLQRQVIISGRVKSINENIYYNVDRLHEAISSDRQIRFRYFQWNIKKEMQFRRNGAWYTASPWCLMWDDENYYMVAYDSSVKKIKHYRVDKMLNISITGDTREGQMDFQQFDIPRYARSVFGMFGGEITRVTFEASNSMAGILIDRFGKDISISPIDEHSFSVHVDVAVSQQFIGWVIALGKDIRITAPESVVEKMREEARRLSDQYLGTNCKKEI